MLHVANLFPLPLAVGLAPQTQTYAQTLRFVSPKYLRLCTIDVDLQFYISLDL